MYKITNKLDVNLTAKGVELKEAFNKLKINYTLDKTIVNEIGQRNKVADEVALADRLETACSFNYVAPIKFDDTNLDLDDREAMLHKSDLNRFYKIASRKKMGFFKLAPMESVELVHDEDILRDLITKHFAKHLEIIDTVTGDVIFDGGLTEFEFKGSKSLKAHDEEKFTIYKGIRTCNLLHPKKELDLYYPTKTK